MPGRDHVDPQSLVAGTAGAVGLGLSPPFPSSFSLSPSPSPSLLQVRFV